MPEALTPKQRSAAAQQWRSLIMRECRDLGSLERIRARALRDHDVQSDAELRGTVQSDLDRRRAELQREEQEERDRQRSSKPPAKSRPAASRPYDSGGRANRDFASDFESKAPPSASTSPRPSPPPPDPDREAARKLVADLIAAMKSGDEDTARTVCARLRTLHGRRSEVVSAADLDQYDQRIEKLRARLEQFRGQIDTMARAAVVAARGGDAEAAVNLMRRLSAIHVAHPRLLDEPGLEQIRRDIVAANEGHEDGLTSRRLLEREAAVSAKVKRLTKAVHDFHGIVCTVPETSREFRRAEAVYQQVLQEVRLHEEGWLAEYVLEIADVLAEWSVPPRGAEKRIDRFHEKVRLGIEQIHKKMDQIDSKRRGAK